MFEVMPLITNQNQSNMSPDDLIKAKEIQKKYFYEYGTTREQENMALDQK